ncbi:MAG: hypothetical protein QXK24_02155 [Ignisphaera sp.]
MVEEGLESFLKEMQVVQISEGKNVFHVSDKPTVILNRWGRKALRIPCEEGILITSSFAIIRAIAKFITENGIENLPGSTITFTVAGTGRDRRYSDVKISLPKPKKK